MIRSILMAVGIFLLILGAQSLLVEKVVVKKTPPSRVTQRDTTNQSPFQNAGYRSDSYYQEAKKTEPVVKRSYHTKEWMPWSLLAAGTITVLYTYSLAHASSDS